MQISFAIGMVKQLVPREGTKTRGLLIPHIPASRNNSYPARGRKRLHPCAVWSASRGKQLVPREGTKTYRFLLCMLRFSRNNSYPARGRKLVFTSSFGIRNLETTRTPRGDENYQASAFASLPWLKQLVPREGTKTSHNVPAFLPHCGRNNSYPARGRKLVFTSSFGIRNLETTRTPRGDILSNLHLECSTYII